MLFASLFCALTPGAPIAREVTFYIGTYTSPNGSKGIYRASLDTGNGGLSDPELAAEAEGPSFLALHPSGRFLYAVLEPTDGLVSAYAIEPNERLRLLNTENTKGAAPCHLSLDRTGKYLFTAAYSGGSFACLPIRPDGSLAPMSAFVQNSGSGPDKGRQEGPHLHSIYADAQNRFVYACDLGTDEVLVYRFDPAKGSLTPAEAGPGRMPPGGGPRHLAIHPNGRFVYVNNEMTNAVTTFSNDSETGAMKELQTLSTLPPGTRTEGKSTAELLLHPNGKWLYVSNRGHDSIAAYEIQPDGLLRLIEIHSAEVAEPRGFDIDPTGKWLVVAGQRSHDLTALAIDPETGRLRPGPSRIRVHSPVCVVFGRTKD